MTSSEFLAYLESQKWFLDLRTDTSLLFYSTKQTGVRRYVKGMYGIESSESMFMSTNEHAARVTNIDQTREFHEASRRMVLDDPRVLERYIKDNDKLWIRMASECEVMDRAVKSGDEDAAVAAFKRVADSYAEAGAQFVVIFSLGLKSTEAGLSQDLLAMHDAWRNTVALKEERMGESWYEFFVFMAERRRINISALDLMRYFSLREVNDWLDGKSVDVNEMINLRKRQGFVYLDLHDDVCVVDDPKIIEAISARFFVPDDVGVDGVIQGQVAFASAERITGEVVLIKDKNDLAEKGALISGRILIAVQTTPHYIPYLKGVKAIVTDEGGITCHAAIVSREMKIACIVGTKNATRILKDGDEVEIDAGKGVVQVLKRNL